jgi:hypothetical protein
MDNVIRGRFAAPTPSTSLRAGTTPANVIPFPRVTLGRVVLTRGIAAETARSAVFAAGVLVALRRHRSGDWGEVDAEDARANDWSLAHGERLLSAYTIEGQRVWILTERDRSLTTVMTPSEY